MTGPLPDGFLQMTPTQPAQPAHQPYQMQQQGAFGGFHQSTIGILNITVVQVRYLQNLLFFCLRYYK